MFFFWRFFILFSIVNVFLGLIMHTNLSGRRRTEILTKNKKEKLIVVELVAV